MQSNLGAPLQGKLPVSLTQANGTADSTASRDGTDCEWVPQGSISACGLHRLLQSPPSGGPRTSLKMQIQG